MGSFYTKILEVNLFAFAYRLFHKDISSIDRTLHVGFSCDRDVIYPNRDS